MRNIYLHAGLPKTGSSAIQAFLTERREALLRFGILVPKAGATDSGNHKPLVLGLQGLPLPPGHQGCVEKFREQVARYPAHTVLLSSEYIGGNIGKERDKGKRFDNLLHVLREAGFRPMVLIYLRPDVERINSSYVQRIKTFSTGTPPFRDFALQQADRAKARYAQLLTLASAAEVEAIFRPYDAEVRRSGVVGDFLATIGIGAEERAVLGEERRMNEAPVGPVAVAAAMATLARLRQSGREIKPLQLAALKRELSERVAAEEPREPSFQGVDADLFQAMEDRVADERERFAQAAWGRSWEDVFASGRERGQGCNIFDPARAEPQALERYERLCGHLWSAAQISKERKAGDKGRKGDKGDKGDNGAKDDKRTRTATPNPLRRLVAWGAAASGRDRSRTPR